MKTLKPLMYFLLAILLILQYRLWVGEGSVPALSSLERELADQRADNAELEQRNAFLEIEVLDLKNGLEAVEERARSELGMIGADEIFYLIVDDPSP